MVPGKANHFDLRGLVILRIAALQHFCLTGTKQPHGATCPRKRQPVLHIALQVPTASKALAAGLRQAPQTQGSEGMAGRKWGVFIGFRGIVLRFMGV